MAVSPSLLTAVKDSDRSTNSDQMFFPQYLNQINSAEVKLNAPASVCSNLDINYFAPATCCLSSQASLPPVAAF